MQINLYTNYDTENTLHKSLPSPATVTGALKDGSSVAHPSITFEVNSDVVPQVNYVYIPEFGRYYFVDDIRNLYNNIWQLSLRVDVLMSFKDDILQAEVVARRSSSSYDKYLPDEFVKNKTDVDITFRKFIGWQFVPSAGSYVLQTVGANPVT